MEYAVNIENLSKTFRSYENFLDRFRFKFNEVKALDNVSLDIKNGEIFGLLGPNGAGKTTLMNSISTLLLPDSGSIKIFGIDAIKHPIDVRKIISLSSAFTGFQNELTMKGNLEIFSLFYNVKPRIEKLVKLLEIEKMINKQFRDLSSGNRQRVVLAKSLMINPKLLLLDELTVALDPHITIKVRKILLDWQKKSKGTIILATHNMYEADTLCDRVAIIHLGKIVALDTPENLKKMLHNEDVIEIKLISPAASLSRIKKLEGVKRVVSYNNRIVIHLDDAESRLHKIIDALVKSNKIISIKIKEPTLEDVFIKLTGARLE